MRYISIVSLYRYPFSFWPNKSYLSACDLSVGEHEAYDAAGRAVLLVGVGPVGPGVGHVLAAVRLELNPERDRLT